MKKFLLCLFSFLFISTVSIGGGLIFAGCNQTHFEDAGGGFEESQNENDENLDIDFPTDDEFDNSENDAPNEDISAQNLRIQFNLHCDEYVSLMMVDNYYYYYNYLTTGITDSFYIDFPDGSFNYLSFSCSIVSGGSYYWNLGAPATESSPMIGSTFIEVPLMYFVPDAGEDEYVIDLYLASRQLYLAYNKNGGTGTAPTDVYGVSGTSKTVIVGKII